MRLNYRLSFWFLLFGVVLALSCTYSRSNTPTVPAGPRSVEVDSAYAYETSASNGKEHGLVYVRFDWGDGDTSLWLGHDETTECSHSWREGGVFLVRAQAHDDREELSEWSSPCSVTVVVPPYPYRLVDSVEIIDAELLDAQVIPNGDFVYVTSYQVGSLAAVRAGDLQVVTQISFNSGWGSLGQVVCSPDGDYVYGT
jgi:hypothetical protein